MPWRPTSAGCNNIPAVDLYQCMVRVGKASCIAMPKLLFGLIAAGIASLAIGSQAREPAGVDPAELTRLVRQDCGSCHGMTLQGGLGAPLTKDALAGQTVESLTIIILHGKHGTAMPPWKTLLSEMQAQWIARHLLDGFPEEVR